ncbi:MAG: hypothetical protein LLF84_03480 [Methanoregulaceae archaeon]|nr:hypothetical protein [Methanoregulaceae archaeon]
MIVGVAIALISLLVGFFLNEFKSVHEKKKEIEEIKRKWAKVIQIECKGAIDALNSNIHFCHRPEYGEDKEMLCRAKRISENSFLSQILSNIQNISNNLALFDDPTIELLFNLKWGISDLIKTANEISSNFKVIYLEEFETKPESEYEKYNYEVQEYLAQLNLDEKFVADTCFKLVENLQTEFKFDDILTDYRHH